MVGRSSGSRRSICPLPSRGRLSPIAAPPYPLLLGLRVGTQLICDIRWSSRGGCAIFPVLLPFSCFFFFFFFWREVVVSLHFSPTSTDVSAEAPVIYT